jgi:3'-phosphoadenosine 5'-phosphosulfate sulfotransferase
MAEKKKEKPRPPGWMDVSPLGGARRIMDVEGALKKAVPPPKPPKKKKPYSW